MSLKIFKLLIFLNNIIYSSLMLCVCKYKSTYKYRGFSLKLMYFCNHIMSQGWLKDCDLIIVFKNYVTESDRKITVTEC